MLKITSLLFTILLSVASWGQSTPTTDWKTLNQPNYSIQFPANWTLDQTGFQGTTFMLLSELPVNDPYQENVNLIIHDLRGTTIYLDKLVKQSESTFQSTLLNYNLIESKRMKGTPEFHKIVFTGEQKNLNLKFVQYIWMKGIKAYVLTFTAEQSQFENYKAAGEKILNSFKIK